MSILTRGLVFALSVWSVAAIFTNEVKPSCGPEEKVCEFNWTISKMETMVWYDKSKHKGFPVLEVNGTFYKRLPDNCNELEELTDEEIQEVATSDGNYRTAYFVNGQFPGPSIVVYEGQQVVVRVTNGLLQEGTSLHWHGMTQHNTPFMDGVPTVTQCAIQPGETFTYTYLATPAGSHWYHSHVGVQRTDGLYGALIVLDKPTEEEDERRPNPALAASNVTQEPERNDTASNYPEFADDYLLFVHDWYREDSDEIHTRYLAELQRFTHGYDDLEQCHYKTMQSDGSEVGTIPFQAGLINGKGRYRKLKADEPEVQVPLETFGVEQGKFYRFRAFNPSLNFAFRIEIDGHKLHVTASDGFPINPIGADSVIVHGGERYDFYIEADQPIDNYWIRAETIERYNGRPYDWDHPIRREKTGVVNAILRYTGAPKVEPTSERRECVENDTCVVVNCPFSHYHGEEFSRCVNMDQITSTKPYSLGAVTESKFEEFFLNFHFPFAKGGVLRSSVNGRQFIPPSAPPQVVGKAIYDHECDEEKCQDEHCSCTYELKLKYGDTIQMVLLSTVTPIKWEGIPASAHPIHLHGHHFHVMKVGYPEIDPVSKIYTGLNSDIDCPTDRCHNATWSNALWKKGHVEGLNEINPPLKDTVIVPAGGYVVIRFKADNPGWWIMHCHLELHQVEGMALLLQEGHESQMNPVPKAFPTCGTFDWSAKDFEAKLNRPIPDINDANFEGDGTSSAATSYPTLASFLVVILQTLLIRW